jgi:hypothetical protein
MNTPNTSDSAQETAHLTKLRAQISTDIEAMQQKEASLKEYEQRLRLLMEHNRQGQPAPQANQSYVTSGPNSQEALDAQWEKYDRAHAAAGQKDNARAEWTRGLALKEREDRLAQREENVSRREAWVKIREQELAAADAAKAAIPETAKPTFTTAPFLAARNLFSRQH